MELFMDHEMSEHRMFQPLCPSFKRYKGLNKAHCLLWGSKGPTYEAPGPLLMSSSSIPTYQNQYQAFFLIFQQSDCCLGEQSQ